MLVVQALMTREETVMYPVPESGILLAASHSGIDFQCRALEEERRANDFCTSE
jgi:hypothetical protein